MTKAAFDIFLPKLREHLGLPFTLNIEQERRFWHTFSGAFFYGEPKAMESLRKLQQEAAEESQDETRATLEQERDQLLADLAQAQERADRLQSALEAECSKGFWRRLFGTFD